MRERQERGGLCYVGSKRYAKSNNDCNADYDPKKKYTHHTYLDANIFSVGRCFNNCHTRTLKVETQTTLATILQRPANNATGNTVEVDLEFPQHLHVYTQTVFPSSNLSIELYSVGNTMSQ